MRKISLVKYEEDWRFFATAIGTVDYADVFHVEYLKTEQKTIVWNISVMGLDAILLSELIYNWDKKVYKLYIEELVRFANEICCNDNN